MNTYCDISLWQGQVDFNVMKSKAVGVFIKTSEAAFVDPRFAVNWPGARDVGLQRGAYHFYRVNTDAGLQARTFIDAMQGDYGDMYPTVDLEDDSVAGQWTQQQCDDLKRFVDIVQARTKRVAMVYTNPSWANAHLAHAPWIGTLHLWIANWKASPAGVPALPSAWSKYDYWQWTSSGNGALYGASSANIDLSVDSGDPPQPTTLTVYADEYARVRMGPSVNDTIMGGVKTGEHVTIAGYAGDWAIVQLSAGGAPVVHEDMTPVIAYIYGGLLK